MGLPFSSHPLTPSHAYTFPERKATPAREGTTQEGTPSAASGGTSPYGGGEMGEGTSQVLLAFFTILSYFLLLTSYFLPLTCPPRGVRGGRSPAS